MSAVINPRTSNLSSLGVDSKPSLLHKIDDHIARINDVILLAKEEGLWTVSDDRAIRLYLKRDNDRFFPSIYHIMPVAPITITYSEETKRLFVGLLNGHVYEFSVAEDFNCMTEERKWTLHAGPVSGIALSLATETIFTCAKDKAVIWCGDDTGNKQGSYHLDSSCTALVLALPLVFVGDHGGNVIVLRMQDAQAQFVSKLSAHTGSITSLAWDGVKEVLYSGSTDSLVIMWDIGGQKGEAFELNGHQAKITWLCSSAAHKRLFSADDSGRLVCWDMNAKRIPTPAWKTSDQCQICESPFFWNVTAMWQKKVFGIRQHHCRPCGLAVCSSCCETRVVLPNMGYEIPVRICKRCQERKEQNPTLEEFNQTPHAIMQDVRTGVTVMHLQETTGQLAIVGQNRTIFIWDVKPLF